MDMMRLSFTRKETEVLRQVIHNGLEHFNKTCRGCQEMLPLTSGCVTHHEAIAKLRVLRSRLNFPD